MSRRRGRRQTPASERRAIRDRYSSTPRRRRTPLTKRPQWNRPVTSGRRWSAVLGGTVVSVAAFVLLVMAIVSTGEGDRSSAALSAVGAALLIPILLVVVGLISRAPTPVRVSVIWSPVLVVIFAAMSFLAGEPATGYVLAVGVGVAQALRAEPGVHNRSWRVWTAAGLAGYTKVVFLLSPALALAAAPLLPVVGVAVIDSVTERRLAA